MPNESSSARDLRYAEWSPILRLWLTRRRELERICLQWTRGCRSDAEDLLSDALARALEANLAPNELTSPRAWLFAIIANLGRDRWRRAAHELILDRGPERIDELVAERGTSDDTVDLRRELFRVLGRDGGLTSAQRHILIERCLGESYRDIARGLEISECLARKLAQQARRHLKRNGLVAGEV